MDAHVFPLWWPCSPSAGVSIVGILSSKWSSLQVCESASHGTLWYWMIWGACNQKSTNCSNICLSPHKQTNEQLSKHVVSPNKIYKITQNCELLGPWWNNPQNDHRQLSWPKTWWKSNNIKSHTPPRLPSHPNARPKVWMTAAAVMEWMRHLMCSDMLRYFLRILQLYAVVTTWL